MIWQPVRSLEPEYMDSDEVSEPDRAAFHRDLALVHRFLGTEASLLNRIRRGSEPVRSVIDIGCGDGAVLSRIRQATGARESEPSQVKVNWQPVERSEPS